MIASALAQLQLILDSIKAEVGTNGSLAIHDAIPFVSPKEMAARIWRARNKRSDIFKLLPFSDPAWDILLYLYAFSEDAAPIQVKSAIFGSGVPSTTALRYISLLNDYDLIHKWDDTTDGRRRFLALTVYGNKLMTVCIHELMRIMFGFAKDDEPAVESA